MYTLEESQIYLFCQVIKKLQVVYNRGGDVCRGDLSQLSYIYRVRVICKYTLAGEKIKSLEEML